VKPQRATNPNRDRRENWWRLTRPTLDLYESIEGMERVCVIPIISKVVLPSLVPNGYVFSNRLIVFAYDDHGHFGVLSSNFHWWWVIARASTLETRIAYSSTDCFETFPQPEPNDRIAKAGRALDKHRSHTMLERREGLTKTYNRVHDAGEHADDISTLRRLHMELDAAVAEAYGWSDLSLDHDFHQTPQEIRFTLNSIVATEVLDRLLELNHQRYAEEVAAGLHGSKASGSKPRARTGQATLIDD
jgi:hypothetical protein